MQLVTIFRHTTANFRRLFEISFFCPEIPRKWGFSVKFGIIERRQFTNGKNILTGQI